MKDIKKGLIIAGAASALIASGFVATSVIAKPKAQKAPVLVKCTKKDSGCGRGCGKVVSQEMTLEECERWGGTPSRLD